MALHPLETAPSVGGLGVTFSNNKGHNKKFKDFLGATIGGVNNTEYQVRGCENVDITLGILLCDTHTRPTVHLHYLPNIILYARKGPCLTR
jgi:hypothetical protein